MVLSIRDLAAFTVLAALGSAASFAQAQPASQVEQARVISSKQLADGGYNVTYEYAGRRYTTRTDSAPGRTMQVQVSAMGVTTNPVLSSQIDPVENGQRRGDPAAWQNVIPEPGVVVSGNGGAPTYPTAYPAPVYAQPGYATSYAAPYPAPIYVQPGYGYAQPYYAAPIGLSPNLGYSRGWGGGGWGGGGWHRGGWR